MLDRPSNQKSSKIELRAAQIRQHWSPSERARRMGLPPDMPAHLQARLSKLPVNIWPLEGRFELVESPAVPLQDKMK